ncbi:hypothetical protein ADUPG1_005658 [Aduncisulcus paluster]|uniref:Uncharacterized protein n=1 Tax=Aduncisulcus paluster TaxID=2918883 RepID=A0ABQ5KH72_9EUKA|nr:hypothetical protein ADUPG1_005658 [Aduncisulcus paluster]
MSLVSFVDPVSRVHDFLGDIRVTAGILEAMAEAMEGVLRGFDPGDFKYPVKLLGEGRRVITVLAAL